MMNKNLITIILAFVTIVGLEAQVTYFQQDVSYKINVVLDDKNHTIVGDIAIQYTNNAPEPLPYIYMHLWGNAFENNTTAFSKQKIRSGNTDFYFAKEEARGGYSDLDFTIENSKVNWSLDKTNIDIARLELDEVLMPGNTITIKTPFTLKIPESFSRLGHVETSYQMTQWYPKPAVYDNYGWHPMPYLDMGEFYSEFGDFHVKITLPDNYVVGATGALLTTSEIEFLEEKMAYTKDYLKDTLYDHTDFPASSEVFKTLEYKAENVHDFAWFADKRFLVLEDKAVLASGLEIPCFAYFTDQERNLWANGAFYVARAVEFYSERVGDYPYPHASAVQSALSAGAGMEYPMITVIGVSRTASGLDQVITHEVGHNWFYGILGSNERDFPWMDEGMNSYHDHKYMDVYYNDYDEAGDILPGKVKRQLEYPTTEYAYYILAGLGKDQAPNTTSNDLTSLNYFIAAYEKPAMAFKYLEHYLGEEEIIKAMNNYYEEWKFKHPQPQDVKASFEKYTGKDLDWLFDGLLFSNKTLDYAIQSYDKDRNLLTISNKGKINGPVHLSLLMQDSIVGDGWYDGFEGESTFEIKVPEAEVAKIDKGRVSLDIQPRNNQFDLVRNSRTSIPPTLRFLSGVKTSKKNKLFVIPVIGANVADGFQIGVGFHNYGFPLGRFQYYLNPAIGTKSGELIGSGMLRYDIPQKGKGALKNISLAVGGKSYHEGENIQFDYNQRFSRVVPSIEFEFQDKLSSPVKHFVRYRSIFLQTDFPQIGREEGFIGHEKLLNVIHDLGYEMHKKSPINPVTLLVNAEYWDRNDIGGNAEYLKLYGSIDASYAYKKGKFFSFRVFGGFFPFNSARDRSTQSAVGNFSMFSRGFNDYRYDHHFLGRMRQEGSFSRQVMMDDGGFKNGISSAYPIGLSNNYMASVNLSVDLPFGWTNLFPIKPYFDAGVYAAKPTNSEPFSQKILYSGGLMVDFKGVISVYLPLLNSNEISNIYSETSNNLLQRISFNINLDKLQPHKLKRWLTT